MFFCKYYVEGGIQNILPQKPVNYDEIKPLFSIIIPVFNKYLMTKNCINSILKSKNQCTYEIIIGNDCSNDNTIEELSKFDWIKVVSTDKNLRFIGNCNNASKKAKGKYILFLNNDTLVEDFFLDAINEIFQSSEDAGIVGSNIYFPKVYKNQVE